LPPEPGTRRLERLRDQEAQREERRLEAYRHAADLLQAASAVRADPVLTSVATLVARTLNVDCDILLFASGRSVVVMRAAWTNGNAPSRLGHESAGSDSQAPTTNARVELVELTDRRSPLDVLRTESTIDRMHVFISSSRQSTPLGILTVQSSTALGLSGEERAFLDALGELIGMAIDSRRLPTGEELRTQRLRAPATLIG